MKLLYGTDHHITGRNPGSRIDNYPEASYRKLLEFEAVATSMQPPPDAIILGGDLYDTPRIADSIKTRYNKILRRIKRKTKAKIYLVPGNHDLFGYSLSTIDQTAIGVMASAGVIELLTRDSSRRTQGRLIKGKDGTTVAIHGQEYHGDIDTNPIDDYEINENPNADYNILFSHGMLVQKGFHPDVRHTLTKDVRTSADMVVNGHYHPGHDIHIENDTIFANPGSTGRDAICKRQPQYAIITADSQSISIEYFEYLTAAHYDDVFDHTAKVQAQTHQAYLDQFEQTIEDAISYDTYDPDDIIDEIEKDGNIDATIIKEARQSIVDVQSDEKVNKLDGFVEASQAIHLESAELENFQSHKHTKVEFSPKGLTTITGPSDSGKSGLVRGIRWALYNEPKGSDFIRHGENSAKVTLKFSNGYTIVRSRTKTSAGEYLVIDPAGNEKVFKGFGNDIPIDVVNAHQMPKVKLTADLERSLNFSYQLDGHFLLSETPATSAAVIGRLTGVQKVDAALKEKRKESLGLTKEKNVILKDVDRLTKDLEGFTDIKPLEDQVNLAKAMLMAAEHQEKTLEQLKVLDEQLDKAERDIQTYQTQLAKTIDLKKTEKLVSKIDKLNDEITEMKALRTEWRRSIEVVSNIEQELAQYEGVNDAQKLIIRSEGFAHQIEALNTLHDDYVKAVNDEKRLSARLSKLPDLKKAEKALAKYEKISEELKELKKLQAAQIDASDELDLAREAYDLAEHNLDKAMKAFEEYIASLDNKCPTCHQDVDSNHLIHN